MDGSRIIYNIFEEIGENRGKKDKAVFLPGYSPQLNPDELVWSASKAFIQRKLATTKKELEKNIASFLHSIQKRKDFLLQLFLHHDVAYINGS